MQKDDYNIEAYKAIREEMNRRIDVHYKIVLTKYVLVGGLFAYVATHQRGLSVGLSPFLLSAAFAFLLDIVILENLGWIRVAGSFIRNTIESSALSIVRWETWGAQPDNRWTCFTVPGYVLGSWSIGVLLLVGAVVTTDEGFTAANLFGVLSTIYLCFYSLYLAFHHLGSQQDPIDRRESPLEVG